VNIIIRNAGDTPIYEQIVTQIKSAILAGELQEGEALPSMRLLARELRISLITTKRAYEELEREGFLYTMTGKGSFVAAKNWDLLREEQRKRVEEHLRAAVQAARLGGVDRRELLELTGLLYDEEAGQAEDLSAPPQE
jgi:GntR family transcriptional regulator